MTTPHCRWVSPRAVLRRVLEPDCPNKLLASLSVTLEETEWLEEEGGVTSRVRVGLPHEGPKPIKQEVKFWG